MVGSDLARFSLAPSFRAGESSSAALPFFVPLDIARFALSKF
jgi:hypothetical protein